MDVMDDVCTAKFTNSLEVKIGQTILSLSAYWACAMFYEEKEINGILHFRTMPNGEWRTSPEWLSNIIRELKQRIVNLSELTRVAREGSSMGAITRADECVNEARSHIKKAATCLSEVVIERAWGYDDFNGNFQEKLRESLIALLEIQAKLDS